MKTNSPELKKLPDKTFILTLTLKKADINNAYQSVMQSVQKDFVTKGFRKGKVPADIVTANVSSTKVIEEVLTRLISAEYSKKIQENHLHPIIQPQIKVINPPVDLDKDWQIEITGCELPEISLDAAYIQEIKKINLTTTDENKKNQDIIDCLVKHSTVNIPEILIKADVDNKLSSLVEQTQQAGLTVNQYLNARHQTLKQYQDTLQDQIKHEWIANLAIDNIAKVEKLTVSESEVKQLTSQNHELAANPNLVYYLLTQQKVFEFLKKM